MSTTIYYYTKKLINFHADGNNPKNNNNNKTKTQRNKQMPMFFFCFVAFVNNNHNMWLMLLLLFPVILSAKFSMYSLWLSLSPVIHSILYCRHGHQMVLFIYYPAKYNKQQNPNILRLNERSRKKSIIFFRLKSYMAFIVHCNCTTQ